MLFREANDKMTVMGEEDEEYTPPGEIFVKGVGGGGIHIFTSFRKLFLMQYTCCIRFIVRNITLLQVFI